MLRRVSFKYDSRFFLLNRKYRQQKGKEKHPSVIKWVDKNGIDCMLNHEAFASEELKFI